MAGMKLVVALCVLFAVASANEFVGGDVVHLTSSNYDDMVSDGKVYFIKYYAPWCGHCKRLALTWKELAADYKDHDKIAIAHVDCTTSRDVCSAAGIKGYPSLKIVHKAEDYKTFKGSRDLPHLKNFVEEAAAELTSESD